MACDHPAPGEDRILPGDRIGEYVVQYGSGIAQGPIPTGKIDEAHDLCRADTGATLRSTTSPVDKECACGAWWSEVRVSPSRSSDGLAAI